MAIDYGLFMVTRFREELHRQPTVEQAVARTVATAGRTVAVSGIIVAVALASLMLFPEDFLRSMGYGGVATVAVDMLAALTVLPALLAVLGPKVNALRIRRRAVHRPVRRRGQRRLVPAGAQRHAQARRLRHGDRGRAAGLGAPFLRISWGGTDARTLPAASTVRQVSEALDSQFPVNSTAPIEALVTGARAPAQLTAYLHRIDAIPGVHRRPGDRKQGDVARVDVGIAAAGVPGGPGTSSPRSATSHPGRCRGAGRRAPPRAWWTQLASLGATLPLDGAADRRRARSCCCSWRSARWCCR